jgi:hypothetical protein
MSQPYDYYYGSEADQYTFYRLPKALFHDARYKHLSDGAKILYGLMLDRMGLSTKNGWVDEQNRVYIIFTLEYAQECMNCKHEKAVKLFAELDIDKGVGLIERVRRGQGKPAIVYVRKFFDPSEVLTSENQKSGPPDMQNPRLPKNRSQDLRKSEANKNDISNTDLSDIEFSPSVGHTPARGENPADGRADDKNALEEIFERCELWIWDDATMDMFKSAIERLYYSESLKIGNAVLPREKVRSYLNLLDAEILTESYEALKQNRDRIRNVTGYVMSVLINGVCEKESGLLVNLPPEYLSADRSTGKNAGENFADCTAPGARLAGADSAREGADDG